MGLARWFANIGSVGGTARWAAKMYWYLENRTPGISGENLYTMLIQIRYPDTRNPNVQALMNMRSQIKGLRGFVAMVLSVESGMLDNDRKTIDMFIEVINEQLSKNGVPSHIANM